MITRMYTYYWTEDSLADLIAATQKLREEWDHRKPHTGDAAAPGEARIRNLELAIMLMAEPVP